MGQRVQTFLITPNVYKKVKKKFLRYKEFEELPEKPNPEITVEVTEYNEETTKEMNFWELEKAFGTEDYSIIAHYHHSLYHEAAVSLAYRVLEYCQKADFVYNIFHQEHWANKFFVDRRTIPRFLKNIESLLSLHSNYEMAQNINAEKGWMPCDFLNIESPYIVERFDRYQNDGGVIIIDTIQQKYCFIDISNPSEYVPWSAEEYYAWGCPQEKSYYLDLAERNRYTEDYVAERLASAVKGYNFVKEYFKDFEVMTQQEVAMYFPAMHKMLLPKDELLLINKPKVNLFNPMENEEDS